MTLTRLLFLILLTTASLTAARKLKRNGQYMYRHQRPIPVHLAAPASIPAPELPPYHFEKVRLEELAPERQKFEHDSYVPKDDYISHDHYGQQTSLSGTFLIDNGLRSIAKGSADQANSAVSSQSAAGNQAAYVAKNALAQAATQAAGTAVAVLKGKEVLLQRLDEQNDDAHKAMQSELKQLQQAKRSAKAAQYAAQQALNHVSILTAALNNAHAASELAQKAASEAAAELASQIDMVARAKTKIEQAEAQVYTARLDYEETKEAAEKATISAQEAQHNANDAALYANVELNSASIPPTSLDLSDTNNDHDVHSIVKRRFRSNEKIKKP